MADTEEIIAERMRSALGLVGWWHEGKNLYRSGHDSPYFILPHPIQGVAQVGNVLMVRTAHGEYKLLLTGDADTITLERSW